MPLMPITKKPRIKAVNQVTLPMRMVMLDVETNKDKKGRHRIFVNDSNQRVIGYGRKIELHGITDSEAVHLLGTEINAISSKLGKYIPEYTDITSEVRKAAMVCLCYHLGVNALLECQGLIEALWCENYQKAANEILKTNWAKRNPKTAIKLAKAMSTGLLGDYDTWHEVFGV